MRKQLVATLGWSLVVGAGIATGIWLGSLGADVPADAGLLRWSFFIAAGATFIVRGLVGVVRVVNPAPEKKPAARQPQPVAPSPASASAPAPEPVVVPEARPRRSEPLRAARKTPAKKKAPAKKQAPRKRTQ